MTTSTTTPGSVDVAFTVLVRELERTWRDWRALIAELRAKEADAAQGEDALLAPPRQRQGRSALATATRRRLMEELEGRRQQAQAVAEAEARSSGGRAPQVDVVYAQLLLQIDEELSGKRHPKGLALVWWHGELHEFDQRALLQAGLSEADYGLSGARRWMPLVAGISVICLLLGGAWLGFQALFGRGASGAGADTLTIRGATVALPQPTALAIGTAVGAATLRLDVPPVACVDAPLRAAVQPGATLVLTDTQSVRRYALSMGQVPTADLTIATCASGAPLVLAQGTLLDDTTVRLLPARHLRGVRAWAADTDPQTIPAGQMRIDLDLDAEIADPAGTLVLADGTRWPVLSTEALSGGLRLRYRVPLRTSGGVTPDGAAVGLPQQAAWARTVPGASLPEVLPIALPAPTTRAMQLAQHLQVLGVEAHHATAEGGAPTLTISLTVRLDAEAGGLVLSEGDGAVVDARGALLTGIWQLPALTPGAAAPVVVTIPAQDLAEPLTVSLGGHQVRLRW